MALFSIRSREIKLWRVVVLFVCISAMLISGTLAVRAIESATVLATPCRNDDARGPRDHGRSTVHLPSLAGRDKWHYTKDEAIDLEFRDGRLFEADIGKGSDDHPIDRSRSDLHRAPSD